MNFGLNDLIVSEKKKTSFILKSESLFPGSKNDLYLFILI